MNYFQDEGFQDELLYWMVRDRDVLRQLDGIIKEEDFGVEDKHSTRIRKAVARVALDFWRRYRDPVGRLIIPEMKQLAHREAWKQEEAQRLQEYVQEKLVRKRKTAPLEALVDRVERFQYEERVVQAMRDMTTGIQKGTLSREEFLQIAQKAVGKNGTSQLRAAEIFQPEELEKRIQRRLLQQRRERWPVLLIDPLDRLVRIIGPGRLGLVIAPTGRGKTLFFTWAALAYALQRLNVLEITLEDPMEDMEDRFDSAVTRLPMTRLHEFPEALRTRWSTYRRLLRARLRVVDGTEGGMTVQKIESVWEEHRQAGFRADVVLVDYDDEIKPTQKRSEVRFEIADIYRDYRAFLARKGIIGWTASQTAKKYQNWKIVPEEAVAEDFGKIRKSSLVLSLGKGDWSEDSIFLWVAKHRADQQHVGCQIVTDKAKMVFYDRERTMREQRREDQEKQAAQPMQEV